MKKSPVEEKQKIKIQTSENVPESPVQPSPELFQQLLSFSNKIQVDYVETKPEIIQDWKRIFGNKLLSGERLVKLFRCAIAKPTLLEGRFWVSDYHIGFKLNWPGQVCHWSIDFIHIRRILDLYFARVLFYYRYQKGFLCKYSAQRN